MANAFDQFDEAAPAERAPLQVTVTPPRMAAAAANAFDQFDATPPAARGVLGTIDDAVRALASGATLGWADKLAAAGNAALGQGNYETNLAQEQARTAQIPTAVRLPSEIAGAVGSTVAAAPVLGPLAAATGAAKLPGLARAILGGAGVGASFGAGGAPSGEELPGATPVQRRGQALGR
jgi:hypothetical protein